jgi:hypothetical protein
VPKEEWVDLVLSDEEWFCYAYYFFHFYTTALYSVSIYVSQSKLLIHAYTA